MFRILINEFLNFLVTMMVIDAPLVAKKVAVIGGGVGCAIAYPQTKKLFDLGTHVEVITGFPKQSHNYSRRRT